MIAVTPPLPQPAFVMSATPVSVPNARPLWQGRAWVLIGIVLSAFTLRTAVTSLTPLLDSLGREFAFGATMTGVFGMVPTAAFALFGVATPALAHRIGLERAALLAMAVAALGLLARGFVGDTWQLLAANAVALAGMGIGNVVLPPLVKRYFADRVGAVSTAYITVLQLGTILPALAAVPLAQASGWRVSLASWSLVAVAASLPWLAVLWMEARGRSAQARELARVHDGAVAVGDEAPELLTAEPIAARGKVWRSPVAWGMTLMFGMTSLITYSMFTWLPKLLVEAGGSAALGGSMVALFSTLGMISALCMPMLAVRIANPFPIVLACVLCYLGGFAGLLLAPMHLTFLWVGLIGLGPSTFPLALTLINLRTRTPGGSAALSGFMQGLGYTISCLGPLAFGWLHEMSHGWVWPFAMLGAGLVVLVIGGRLACKPRFLEDTW